MVQRRRRQMFLPDRTQRLSQADFRTREGHNKRGTGMMRQQSVSLLQGDLRSLCDQRLLHVECSQARRFEVLDDFIVDLIICQRGLTEAFVGSSTNWSYAASCSS